MLNNISSKADLKNYILTYINNKSVKSLTIAIRNSKKLQNLINTYESCFRDLTFSARAYIICYGRPKCKVCDNYTNFDRQNWKFLENCSQKCQASNSRIINKRKKTNIQKYGYENPSSSDIIKQKVINTNRKRYGADWFMNTTMFNKKSEEWCIKTHGVRHYSMSNKFKDDMIHNNQTKYGVDWYFQTDEFNEKSKSTCIEKYGETHHMKNLSVFEKQQRHSYYKRPYKFPSGKQIYIQGYENLALDFLLTLYSEYDIITSISEIYDRVGKITYEYNNTIHRYFPDIYIPSDNLIIEVKSTRTLALNTIVNDLKKQACIDLGLNFKYCIPHKGNIQFR